jgi:molecular chaperone GrpE
VTETDAKRTHANGQPADADAPAETGPEDMAPTLEDVIAERDDYLDKLQRSVAEFANYRRRTEQERLLIRERAGEDLLKQVLPVLDDLQRALANVPADQADTSFVQGIRLVEQKFLGALERAGLAPLEALGQPFDPAIHDAVDIVPGSAADTVVNVYQPGYRLGSTLLRPAVVRVGDAPDPQAQKEGG